VTLDSAEQYLRPEPWYRRPATLDRTAFVVSLAALAGETVHLLGTSSAVPVGAWFAFAFALAGVGVIVARRSAWAGLVFVLGGALTSGLAGWDPITLWTIAVFTVFSATVRGVSAVRSGLVTALVTALSEALALSFQIAQPEVTLAAATSIAGAAAGSALLSQHRYWRSLEERTRDALLTREAEADRRVAEERLRIARDLHDVVGHEVAIVSMHLGVAEVSLPSGADAARRALADARIGVQAVLHETQEILLLLRASSPPTDDDTRPAPGTAGLEALVASFEGTGLDVRARLACLPPGLDATIDTAVYRIVQEALTNALKYGRGTVDLDVLLVNATIIIRARNDRRTDDVVDGRRAGLGLVGMTERARSAGGDVDVAADEATFTVTVTLDIDRRHDS